MNKEKAMPTNNYQDGSILKSYVLFPMMREVGWIFKFPQIRFIPLIAFKSLW